jgi:ubiquinone/menaquinone biosynthesis C-methylase UbiE
MGGTDDNGRTYTFGYSPAAVGMMESRTAEANARFFLGHLTPGMRLLDIGCGPGSITVGLAAAVAPGEAVGVDIEPAQVALGQGRAKSLGLENCRFEVGSVYHLPVADRSVDAVFGHTILMQFRELDPVLAEVNRVLKPGGLVGFREIDLGASLFYSETSALRDLMSTFRRTILHNDGNPDIGRRLPGILADAGSNILAAGATYTCAATPRAKADMYAAMARLWEQGEFVAQAESLGWIDAAERSAMPERLKREAAEPGSLSGTSYVEVVGRKAAPAPCT